MSFQDGWAAMNLQMPPRVPRTEFSANMHWDLVRAVTGMSADESDPDRYTCPAAAAFVKAWNYDFWWNTTVFDEYFGQWKTSMGHAVYQAGGVDYNDKQFCPFTDPEEIFAFDPAESLGSVEEMLRRTGQPSLKQRFETDYETNRRFAPDAVNMTGVYTTCVSGLIAMLGWDMLLLAAGTDADRFGQFTNRYCRWMQEIFNGLAESDVPVVMVHDDIVWTSGPFIHPDWYRQYVFPNYKKLFRPILESGKKLMYTSDGNFSLFIDDLAQCGVNGFVMEPVTDMAYIAEKYGKTHVFVGNADTRILLSGSKAQIRAEVERCMAIGKSCPGFFMAVGNHIPPNTPVENALYYNEVYEELGRR